MNKKILIGSIILIGLTFCIIIFYNHQRNYKPEVPKNWIYPKKMTIERKIVIPGTIITEMEIQVKSFTSGILQKLYFRVGDYVTEGDVIAKVKAISDPISMEKLNKQLHISIETKENKLRSYNRAMNLFKEKALAESELETFKMQYLVAEHELKSINNEINLLSENSEKNSNLIKATASGTIMELPIKVGGAVMARSSFHEGSAIASIANLNELRFEGKIMESEIENIQVGSVFDMQIGAKKGELFTGKIINISPKGVSGDGAVRFTFWANINSTKKIQNNIRAGYSAIGTFVLEKKDSVLALEEKVIQFSGDTIFVEVLDTLLMVYKKQIIETGLSNGISIEIITGVTSKSKVKI